MLPTGERKTEPREVGGLLKVAASECECQDLSHSDAQPALFLFFPHCAHALPSDASVPQEEKYRCKTVTNTVKSDNLEMLKMRKGRKKGEGEGRRGAALGVELLFFIINSLAFL